MREFDKLADAAKDPNIVLAVHALPDSEFLAYVRRLHAAYYALAGSSATDAGASVHARKVGRGAGGVGSRCRADYWQGRRRRNAGNEVGSRG
jgi:hypothetical protein